LQAECVAVPHLRVKRGNIAFTELLLAFPLGAPCHKSRVSYEITSGGVQEDSPSERVRSFCSHVCK